MNVNGLLLESTVRVFSLDVSPSYDQRGIVQP
jgi:hypothetical protein